LKPGGRRHLDQDGVQDTEFVSYLAVLAGLPIAGVVVDDTGDGGFGASKVWLYATILTVGYQHPRPAGAAASRGRSGPGRLHGPELPSHLEVTLAVAAGVADAAVGIRAAAETVDLDFVPLAWEPFELALTEDRLDAAGDLLDALGRAPAMAGMDLSDAGAVRRP
jgi:hypothetical protein